MDPLHSQPSQEYPIRALVLFRAATAPRLLGTVMNMRHCAEPGCRCGGYWAQDKVTNADHYFTAKEVIIDPTPAQVAEERAKAGLPAAEGEALPERSEGDQPSLLDRLVAALREYGGHKRGPEICEVLKHSDYPCTCGFDAALKKAEGR